MQLTSVEDFLGLKLAQPVELKSNIVGIVGRNGSGKTRLLQAIATGKVRATIEGQTVPPDRILSLPVDRLQPSLVFGFDPVRHRDELRQAAALYEAHRGKFHADAAKSLAQIGPQSAGRMSQVNTHQLVHVVSAAGAALEKDVNSLTQDDIVDFYAAAPVSAMGSLNVTATILAYWDRIEKNGEHEFRNAKYGSSLPFWTPVEFESRFGPPPWMVLNELLQSILDGKFHIKYPTNETIASYEAKLFREDDREIDPNTLSSGEKVLMWLCLSMYAVTSGRLALAPTVILLDEPDAALHPQMVQKLHVVLQTISKRFNSHIIFTTHSPTTVALFDAGQIFRVSEDDLKVLDRDAAIGELLVGVDRVSVSFSNRRQVFVESFRDAELYQAIFGMLRTWGVGVSPYISLSFVPAAPKVSSHLVRQLLETSFKGLDSTAVESFIDMLNGQGNCAQVVGAVESLAEDPSANVRGVVDWDLEAKPEGNLHVFAHERFYATENAILNPLTLGLFLLQNHAERLHAVDYGLQDGYDPTTLSTDEPRWQSIADAVTQRVLGIHEVHHDIECTFLRGERVKFDSRYAHMQGHELETKVRGVYPFLNAVPKRLGLLMEVVVRGMRLGQGRSMPADFSDLFAAIQQPSTSSIDSQRAYRQIS